MPASNKIFFMPTFAKPRLHWLELAFLAVILTGAVFSRFPHLHTAPLHEDEILSITAAQAIVEDGLPRFPSGALYIRSPFSHYLLAGFIFIFGDNQLAYHLYPFVFSLFTLILVYFFGRRYFGRGVAVASVLFLLFSRFENSYSYFARMYMQFQFFTLLCVWFFYEGFIRKRKKYIWVFVLTYAIAFLTHQGALILLPAFFAYLFLSRKKIFLYNSEIIPVSIVLALSLLWYILPIPGEIDPFTVKFYPIGLYILIPSFYPQLLESFMPLSIFFAIFGGWRLLKRSNMGMREFVFTTVLLVLVGLPILTTTSERYIFFIFPMYVLMTFYSVSSLLRVIKESGKQKMKILLTSLLFLAIVTHFVMAFYPTPSFIRFAGETYVYGFQSLNYDYRPYYSFLSRAADDNDIIICADTSKALWYYRCDYLIKNRFDGNAWGEFEQTREPYFGLTIIDSIDDLEKVVSSSSRVWIAAEQKMAGHVSPEIRNYIYNNFELIRSERNGMVRLYASSLKK